MKTIKKVAEIFTGGNEIATTIDSTSTNSQVAGAKAVYDLINKPRATYVLNDNVTINPSSAYTPIDIKTVEDYNNDNSIFSYNANTGELTILKAGKYKFRIVAQLRGSANTTSNVFVMKGFGFRSFRSGTIIENYNVVEQCYINDYGSIYGETTADIQQNDIIKAYGYSTVRSGTVGSLTTIAWGSKRCAIDIELVEESTSTLRTTAINTSASLMNTGSLVGMGDRTELTSLEVADTNVGEIPSEDKAEVTVEEKTLEVEPIETLKEEKESGDTI